MFQIKCESFIVSEIDEPDLTEALCIRQIYNTLKSYSTIKICYRLQKFVQWYFVHFSFFSNKNKWIQLKYTDKSINSIILEVQINNAT